VRALYSSYNGPLYQVKNSTTGTTQDIGLISAGGYVKAADQDAFCTGPCTITTIYDQSANANDLTPTPAGGGNKPTPDNPVNAADLKISIGGNEAYGVFIKQGMGYRKVFGKGTATGDDPETEYMVTTPNHLVDGCCFDYGNAETTMADNGEGAMEAVYFGGGVVWGTGSPGGHNNGPWVMADLENGVYAGWDSVNQTDLNIASNTPLKFNYITAMLVGDVSCQNNGKGRFALYGGDATTAGPLITEYDGIRPEINGYNPMKKQGSIILGTGGDNTDTDGGQWFEGVMATGAASLATCNAVQANIVAAGYGQ